MPQHAMGRRRVPERRSNQSSATRQADKQPSAGTAGRRSRQRATAPAARASRPPRPAPSALDTALANAVAREYPDVGSFAELGLPSALVEALRRRGLQRPFAIQTRALPDALAGRDVLGRAATGSGKTLAFGLPILARLSGTATPPGGRTDTGPSGLPRRPRLPGAPRALVLVPSRELASQVSADLTGPAEALGLKVTRVVGGVGYASQIDALTAGVDLVIATPGRLVDLIERQVCHLDQIEITALDEADYMADLGFLPVVTRLLELTPPQGQRLLFSATLDRGVAGLVDRFLHEPAVHAVAPATATITSMTHRVFVLEHGHKTEIAAQVAARPARTLFFVRTKRGADRLAQQLVRAGIDAAALHGNLAQNARQRVLAAFSQGHTRVLVATDVAARGLHVDGVDLVVHYDPPADHKDYLHRSGRTARAGNTGTVVAFIQPDQTDNLLKLHHDANVTALIETVTPGHDTVQALASSGEPVTVQAGPPHRTPMTARTRHRPRQRRPGTGGPRRAGA